MFIAGCNLLYVENRSIEGNTVSEKTACSLTKEFILERQKNTKLDTTYFKCIFPYPQQSTNNTLGINIEPTQKHPDFNIFQGLKNTYEHQKDSYKPYMTLFVVVPEAKVVINASDINKLDQNIFMKKDGKFKNISNQELHEIITNPVEEILKQT